MYALNGTFSTAWNAIRPRWGVKSGQMPRESWTAKVYDKRGFPGFRLEMQAWSHNHMTRSRLKDIRIGRHRSSAGDFWGTRRVLLDVFSRMTFENVGYFS